MKLVQWDGNANVDKDTTRGHKCTIYTQLAVLYRAPQPRPSAMPPLDDPQVSAPSPAEPATFWTRETCSWLSNTCSVCHISLSLEQMHEHLQTHHAQDYDEAMAPMEHCTSPNLFCCNFCLRSEEVVDCPVALNLAYHTLPIAANRVRDGRHDGPSGGHLWAPTPNRRPSTSQKKKTKPAGDLVTSLIMPCSDARPQVLSSCNTSS